MIEISFIILLNSTANKRTIFGVEKYRGVSHVLRPNNLPKVIWGSVVS